MRSEILWKGVFTVLAIFCILFVLQIFIPFFCTGNDCCDCGICPDVGSCHHCQCLGSDSEVCHASGWDKRSPCCNESATIDECSAYPTLKKVEAEQCH